MESRGLNRNMKEDSQNYFTEIEDHFRATRGTRAFILSPLDWALIETWRDAGIPLKIVLRGIDLAFQKMAAGGVPELGQPR